ncbi:3-oxoacyl-ACP reductase FabG [Alkalibacter mobilis]|uniref:3-oxoacyl-ACP reductase FabG n=1 Tax=Alkalibacter mobilis TaxID=2787712 RepID=UPI00189F7F3A|nr:3-oxoacyl-ACP reductase FabG [Alkalibacter mobilis]MBF7095621.1 3-oxoacyl-ACP reductase FabG [Alkalibacter mobilis]
MSLKDKVVIVTGSAQGLGKAMILKLAQEGAKTVVTDINHEACDSVKNEIIQAGGIAISVKCNVTDRNEVRDLIDNTLDSFGKVDVFINNAGITRDAQITKMTDLEWDAVIETDLKSMFICIQEVVKHMIPRGYGKIVNITSVAGEEGNFGQANYSAAKAGVIGLTKTLSKELGKKGITVNAVAPGFILTEMTKRIPEKIKDQLIGRIPLKRGGLPEEVADAVVFLASDKSSFITGHTLNVNGGMYV